MDGPADDPEMGQALCCYVRAAVALGRRAAADRAVARLVQRLTESPEGADDLTRAGIWLESEDLDVAERLFERVIRETPEQDIAVLAAAHLGRCYLTQGRESEAEAVFEGVLGHFSQATNPHFGEAAYAIGEAYWQRARAGIHAEDKVPEPSGRVPLSAEEQHDLTCALAAWETILQDPCADSFQHSPDACLWVGRLHDVLGDTTQAVAAYEALVRRWPESEMAPGALAEIAHLYERELRSGRDGTSTEAEAKVREAYARVSRDYPDTSEGRGARPRAETLRHTRTFTPSEPGEYTVTASCGASSASITVIGKGVQLEKLPAGNNPDLEPGRMCVNAQPEYKRAQWKAVVVGGGTAKVEWTGGVPVGFEGIDGADTTALQDGDEFWAVCGSAIGDYAITLTYNECTHATDSDGETVFRFLCDGPNTRASNGQVFPAGGEAVKDDVGGAVNAPKTGSPVATDSGAFVERQYDLLVTTAPSGMYDGAVEAKAQITSRRRGKCAFTASRAPFFTIFSAYGLTGISSARKQCVPRLL